MWDLLLFLLSTAAQARSSPFTNHAVVAGGGAFAGGCASTSPHRSNHRGRSSSKAASSSSSSLTVGDSPQHPRVAYLEAFLALGACCFHFYTHWPRYITHPHRNVATATLGQTHLSSRILGSLATSEKMKN